MVQALSRTAEYSRDGNTNLIFINATGGFSIYTYEYLGIGFVDAKSSYAHCVCTYREGFFLINKAFAYVYIYALYIYNMNDTTDFSLHHIYAYVRKFI